MTVWIRLYLETNMCCVRLDILKKTLTRKTQGGRKTESHVR